MGLRVLAVPLYVGGPGPRSGPGRTRLGPPCINIASSIKLVSLRKVDYFIKAASSMKVVSSIKVAFSIKAGQHSYITSCCAGHYFYKPMASRAMCKILKPELNRSDQSCTPKAEPMEPKWNGNGTDMERKWNENGTEMERK
jgi:hypothetical protein